MPYIGYMASDDSENNRSQIRKLFSFLFQTADSR